MQKMVEDKKINIDGFLFDTDDVIYQVVPKYDPEAPEGFRELRTTKLPNSAGRSILAVPYIESAGLWDTGLYEDSPMYANLPPKERAEIVEKVNKYIVEPFERKFGKGKLDPRDIESKFWNRANRGSFKVDLTEGKIFNTRKPEDTLQLFIAIMLGKLAPKSKESSHQYRSAQFCVENKDSVKTVEQENVLQESDAIYNFQHLLRNKPNKLKIVLNYVGLKTPNDMDKGITTQMFMNFISGSQKYQNTAIFLEAVEKSNKAKGLKELNFYKQLQVLYKKGIVVKQGEFYFLEGAELGTGNLKNCAEQVAKSQDLQKIVLDTTSK